MAINRDDIFSSDLSVSPVGSSTFLGEELYTLAVRSAGQPLVDGIPVKLKSPTGWTEGTLKLSFDFVPGTTQPTTPTTVK